MKRLLQLALLLAIPLAALGQTQQDRIAATTYLNRSIPTLSGTQPDVSLGNVFQTNSNGSIATFLNGTASQQIWVICADALTTFTSGGNIVVSGESVACAANTVYSFIFNGTSWVQSGNTGSGGGGGGGGTTVPGIPANSIQFNCAGAFCGDASLLFNSATKSVVAQGNGTSTIHQICGSNTCGDGLQVTASTHTTSLSGGTTNVSGTATNLSGATSLSLKGSTSSNSFLWPAGTPVAGLVPMTGSTTSGVTAGSWSNNFTGGLQATLGTLTTDINPFNLTFTLNNAAQTFNGVVWNATNTAYGANTFDYQFCADTIKCLTMNPFGVVQAPNQVGSGDGSAAGNLQMLQGPQPTILANNVGFGAPTTVDAGGAFAILPGTPCSGILSSFILSAPIYQLRCSNSAQNKASSTTLTSTVTNGTLCSTANCPQGDYEIRVHADSNQVCADATGASLAFTITFTDDAGTKTNQTIPWSVNGSATLTTTMALGDVTHNASGSYQINSSGANPITYTATVAGCATGTARASYKIEAVRF